MSFPSWTTIAKLIANVGEGPAPDVGATSDTCFGPDQWGGTRPNPVARRIRG
jgi:hypothetical protein